MPTGKLQGLRRKIVALIGVGGVVLAILGGGVAYLVEMRRLDGLVEQMARDQALHLVHALQSGQGMAGSPGMPSGSPGMEGPKEDNIVQSFGPNGSRVFGKY